MALLKRTDCNTTDTMKKKKTYCPPLLTVAAFRTEHCFESAPLDTKMGFEKREVNGTPWGKEETQNSEEDIDGQRWYY